MTRRVATAAAISAGIVILAALSIYALRAERPGPASGASPTPTATASPTPAAAASPSEATPTVTDRYGYVFTAQEERITVRRERDAAPASMQGATSPVPGPPVFERAGVSPAVSPDGKRLAYWRTAPNIGATDLRVLDVTDPRTDRSVFTVTSETVGGSVVWSNDGQGLLVGIASRETVGGGAGVESGNPARYDLLMLDLTSAPPRTRMAAGRLSRGAAYLPVAWDRPGRIAAAVVTGPGGFATDYVTWNGNAASPLASARVAWCCGRIIAGLVQASPDSKLVLSTDLGANVLHVWPILDITKADEVRHPLRIASAIWRPGPTAPYEVIWTVGFRIDLFRYRTDSSTTLYTSTELDVGVAAVRPDGSAVLITQSSGGLPPSTTRLLVVDVATRQTTDISTTVGGVHPLSRGVLLR